MIVRSGVITPVSAIISIDGLPCGMDVVVLRPADSPAAFAPLGEPARGEFAEQPEGRGRREPCLRGDARGAESAPDRQRVQDRRRLQVKLVAR
jgi:hypothetical protein